MSRLVFKMTIFQNQLDNLQFTANFVALHF